MNVNLFTTKDYGKFIPLAGQKNKPKQTQFPCPQTSAIAHYPLWFRLRRVSQIPSINSKDRLIFCSGKYSLDVPAFAGKQADVIIFPENGQYSFTAFFA